MPSRVRWIDIPRPKSPAARLSLVLVASGILALAAPRVAHSDGPEDKATGATTKDNAKAPESKTSLQPIPDSRHVGGEPDGIVRVANLVYAGTKSSRCFADHFLIRAEKESSISTSRRFHAVKLASNDIYDYPLLIMTGEGSFRLSDAERESLRRYIERGGFLLSSAGCSSSQWDRSFRREIAKIFPQHSLTPLDMSHPIFHMVYEIKQLRAAHGTPRPLEAVRLGGRVGLIYSQDGLNDTGHTEGCCCCGGNELRNAIEINVNILAYALTF